MQVAVLGGGYAGVALTRRLERMLPRGVDVLLVDDTAEHLIQHELHRLIRFPSLREQLVVPLDEVFDGVDVLQATVDAVDVEGPAVHCHGEQVIEPTYLAICLGAVTDDHGLPGIATYGQPLKRIEDAVEIRDRFGALGSDDRVLIGGAGLSGIQVAGELAAMRPDGSAGPEILLIEREETIAPRFPDRFREATRDALEEAGVTVQTGLPIVGTTAEAVEIGNGDRLVYDQLIWTGGITGPAALDGRRDEVRADLRLADATFALGDAARVIDESGAVVPPSAQTAVRQAETAATNIARLVDADRSGSLVFDPRLVRYRYEPRGWVVSVGDDAVAQVGETVLRGSAARAMKAAIGAGYLSSIGRIRRSMEFIAEEVGPSPA